MSGWLRTAVQLRRLDQPVCVPRSVTAGSATKATFFMERDDEPEIGSTLSGSSVAAPSRRLGSDG